MADTARLVGPVTGWDIAKAVASGRPPAQAVVGLREAGEATGRRLD
jgi:hypothetical protein